MKQIPLSDTAGMVARGEAIGGDEAERLEAEHLALLKGTTEEEPAAVAGPSDSLKEDDGELVSQRR
ncbi:UNVERIFIED_ORG: hypothetical protein ABIB52_000113 [Arthrobacter sp. UYCu721]